MTLSIHKPVTTRLAYRRILKLRDREGDRVDCLDGSVWITQESDPRDVVLDAGQSFTLDRTGTALVCALTNASVTVERATSPASRASADALRRLRDVIAAPWSAAWQRATLSIRRG